MKAWEYYSGRDIVKPESCDYTIRHWVKSGSGELYASQEPGWEGPRLAPDFVEDVERFDPKLKLIELSDKRDDEYHQAVKEYRAACYKRKKEFKDDAIAGSTLKPDAAAILFDAAWDESHANGVAEVYERFEELETLFKAARAAEKD